MNTITLDIVRIGDRFEEIITFGYASRIIRPMFSILRALESLRGKFDFDKSEDNNELYVKFQENILKNLINNDYNQVLTSLELYGENLNNFIESKIPINTQSIKEYVLFEINTIEEFLLYLFPGELKFTTGFSSKPITLNNLTPSEKYTTVMDNFNSYISSKELFDEMRKTFYGDIIPQGILFQDRSFVPGLKSLRYSQLSEDIRNVYFDISLNSVNSDEGKRIYKTNKQIKTKYYHSSNGIFPLIWAEIKFAIENDILIKECEHCGNYFTLGNNNKKKIYCNERCRDSFRKKKDAENPNYEEISKLKMRKSRVDSQAKKDEIQLQIDKLAGKKHRLKK